MRKLSTIAILTLSVLGVPAMQAAVAQSTPQAETAPRVIAPEDRPSKDQLEKLFEQMRLKQQMQTMMSSMSTMMQQQMSQQIKTMAGKNLPEEKQAELDKIMRKYMDRAMTMYPVSEMIDDISTIYQRHLSKEDVDGLIAFYSSSAGQHLLDEQPAIMKEYLPVVSQRMQERSKALTEEMTKDIEQFAKPSGQSK